MEALGSFGGKRTNRVFAAHQHADSLGHNEEVLTKRFLQPSSFLTTLNKPPPRAGHKKNRGSKVGSGIHIINRMHNKPHNSSLFLNFLWIVFLFVMHCLWLHHSELITAESQLSPEGKISWHDFVVSQWRRYLKVRTSASAGGWALEVDLVGQ